MDFRLSRFRKLRASSLLAGLVVLCACLLSRRTEAQSTVLIATNSVWKYLDDGSDQGYDWVDPFFYDDTGWASGPAELGYGDDLDGRPEATVVGSGPNANDKFITTYFRHAFYVENVLSITNLRARLLRDDGAVVYLNGVEVFRSAMPDGPIDYRTLASLPGVSGVGETTFYTYAVDPSFLIEGDNLMAVEVHQYSPMSSDISFALELTVQNSLPPPPPTPRLTRGPYLQTGTPTSIIVRWRSNLPGNSVVRYGADPNALTSSAIDPAATTEHIVQLRNLLPGTKYFYAVDTAGTTLAGGSDCFFLTFPSAPKPTRIWAIGDCGTAGTGAGNAVGVRNAYEGFTGSRYTDIWLMLGDNAYNSGTDAEYQRAVFEVYTNELRRTVLWATMGNHDSNQDPNPSPTLPYFLNFSFPQNGEAGGLPSGTESYYSFDYGNIHFVCLDAMTASSRQQSSAMLTWLQSDLAANTNEWLIAFWHHPPYTMGSHNSDTEIELIEMRANAVPILESYGVDLVLGGHSHNYERSFLLNGHYGTSTSLNAAMIRDGGSGRPTGTGAYVKPTTGPSAGLGTVYAVAGSSGWATFRVGYHPAMYISELETGSLVIDIDGHRLDAKFLRETGAIDDTFTIIKDTPEPLRLATVSISPGKVVARWSSIPGRRYQLQRTPTLENPAWTTSSPITATSATTFATNSVPPDATQGFYRVIEIPE